MLQSTKDRKWKVSAGKSRNRGWKASTDLSLPSSRKHDASSREVRAAVSRYRSMGLV
jgi:hypothetical protein